ncbi:MAG TPA: hypothetical protein VK866_01375 [Acidimicrobiales bacterium]|nr:hypothetical protein [Acidimicrobiales bacterium]
MSDPQDRSEALDDDKLAGEYPPDRPLGAESYGTTPGEERVDEPLADRVAREEPEDAPPSDRPVAPLVGDDVLDDREEQMIAAEARPGSGPGAIEPNDPAAGDPTRRDVATEHEAGLSAEEAAVHETEPPPS